MDDITKTWMFFSWQEDTTEENLRYRNLGCLIGSFWNPKMADDIMGFESSSSDSLEGGNTVKVTEEQFDYIYDKFVKNQETKKDKKLLRKKRKNHKIDR